MLLVALICWYIAGGVGILGYGIVSEGDIKQHPEREVLYFVLITIFLTLGLVSFIIAVIIKLI